MSRKRVYDSIFANHLAQNRQMLLVTGPRQVGKTTTCRSLSTNYQTWESTSTQRAVLQGTEALANFLHLDAPSSIPTVVAFDELHKFPRWKALLKGFFDLYGDRCKIIVTGSSRLDIYRRGGDSLMGRYFLYRMHPFSVAECLRTEPPTLDSHVRKPAQIEKADWDALWKFGGFPEPFLKRDPVFSAQWSSLRLNQLSKEEIREGSQIQNLSQIGVLIQILAERSSEQLIMANVAQEIAVAPKTAKEWVSVLESLHFGFTLRPWHNKIANALRKEPKWYLRDWSTVADAGKRAETLVACHLLKACHGWTDMGFGRFELFYLRTKQKKEVDFLVSKDGKPWALFEVKSSERSLSRTLVEFAEQLQTRHAFQVVLDMPYDEIDCFSYERPIVVPAMTILSQLL